MEENESKNILKKIFKNENFTNYIIILIVSIIISIPLTKGYIIGHDSDAHISRVMSTVISLKSHQILPMISSNYVNGLGYSWNLFYPPLTNYLAVILRVVCQSYTQSLNLLVFFSIIISGIFMYNFAQKVSKSKKVGLLSAVFYITIPYRISDIYVRYAMGEIVSFAFLPLVFNGLYSILEENGKRNYLLTIGAVGLLLTHNITTLLVIIVCNIFVILHIDRFKKLQVIRDLLINAIFILLIVACFYGPFVESKNATDYAVFGGFTNEETLSKNAVSLWEILIGKLYFKDEVEVGFRISVAIGLVTIIPLVLTPFIYKKIEKSKRRMYIISIVLILLTIFASSKYMVWNFMPEIFKYIQFPYRLLIITSFLISIISAINLEKIFEKFTYRKILIITIIALVYITPLLICTKVDQNYDENKYYEIEKNENPYPGSKSDFSSTYEYLPSNGYNNLVYLFERSRNPEFLIGPGAITEVQIDRFNNYIFHVENFGTNILKIEMPMVYYLGYEVTFEGENLGYEESDLGLIMITTPDGKSGTMTVKYTGTELAKKCLITSVISGFVFVIYILISEIIIYKKRKRNI